MGRVLERLDALDRRIGVGRVGARTAGNVTIGVGALVLADTVFDLVVLAPGPFMFLRLVGGIGLVVAGLRQRATARDGDPGAAT